MPSLYAHSSFGKEIYRKLPSELRKIIQKYPKAYNAGLQGPDFLFFYRPFIKCRPNRLGHAQHRKPFRNFLEQIRSVIQEKGKDCGEYAYMLGFICHFMLDSECHTYVNKKAKEPGYNHLVMEIEFDRYLMKKDGKNPFLYPIWKHINWDDETLDAIHGIYNTCHISRKKIEKSLKSMSFIKWFFTTGKTFRRLFVRFVMFISCHYRKLEGHMMDLIPKNTAAQTNRILEKIYRKTIEQCVAVIQHFDTTVLTDEPFHERFSSTFKNNTWEKKKRLKTVKSKKQSVI